MNTKLKTKKREATLVKVKRHFQVTIPDDLRKQFRLVEGDYMKMEISDDGLILRPVKVVHPDQEYFFTKEWQLGESEADRDIANGDVIGDFKDVKSALKALKKAKV